MKSIEIQESAITEMMTDIEKMELKRQSLVRHEWAEKSRMMAEYASKKCAFRVGDYLRGPFGNSPDTIVQVVAYESYTEDDDFVFECYFAMDKNGRKNRIHNVISDPEAQEECPTYTLFNRPKRKKIEGIPV